MSHRSCRTMHRLVMIAVLSLGLAGMSAGLSKEQGAKPGVAVLEFKNKADAAWWSHGGAEVCQDLLIAELAKSGKFRVVDRRQLLAIIQEKNLSLIGDEDAATAIRIGRLLDVNYILTGMVTEFRADGRPNAGGKLVAALYAQLIDTSTGTVMWKDDARFEENSALGKSMFDTVMKPAIQKLMLGLNGAEIR